MELPLLLAYSTPVALAAVGEVVVEKTGVLNIGLEGTMLCGAFFAMLATHLTGSPWLGVLAGVGVGVLVSAISSWFMIQWSADQVVVGTAINLLALGITGSLFRASFSESGQLVSVARIPNWNGLDFVIGFMLVSVAATWFIMRRTRWGLAARATGEMPIAAEAAGFSVARLRTSALLYGGAFAGLAGAYLAVGIAGSFAENMTAGRGFVAIAMVTFGRWNPFLVLAAAMLVGYADSLQFALQARNLDIAYQFFVALPYIVALAVLVLSGRGALAPRALGVAYRREN